MLIGISASSDVAGWLLVRASRVSSNSRAPPRFLLPHPFHDIIRDSPANPTHVLLLGMCSVGGWHTIGSREAVLASNQFDVAAKGAELQMKLRLG